MSTTPTPHKKKRRLSAAGRRAISLAVKRYWASYRKNGPRRTAPKSTRRKSPRRLGQSPSILRDVLKEVLRESFGL